MLSSQRFVIMGRHYLLHKPLIIALENIQNTFFKCLNALFKHFINENIVSQLEIVTFEISIHVCFVMEFLCKSIKKVSQNMSLSCPTPIPKV